MKSVQKISWRFVALLLICISQRCHGLSTRNDTQSRSFGMFPRFPGLNGIGGLYQSPFLLRPFSNLFRRVFKQEEFKPEKVTCESLGGTTCYSKLAPGLCVVQKLRGFVSHGQADAYCAQYANGKGKVYAGTLLGPDTPYNFGINVNSGFLPDLGLTPGDVFSYFSCLGIQNQLDNEKLQVILLGPVPGVSAPPRCTYLYVVRDFFFYVPTWNDDGCPFDTTDDTIIASAPVCVVDVPKTVEEDFVRKKIIWN